MPLSGQAWGNVIIVAIRARLPRPWARLVTLPLRALPHCERRFLSCTAKNHHWLRCLTDLAGSARSGCRLIAPGAAVAR